LTPRPVNHQEAVDEWLWRHGLGLEPREFFVEGVAYFLEIEPGCMRDAMDRLAWLEHVFGELNQQLDRAGRRFWKRVEKESDLAVEKLGRPPEPDEIAPLPERYRG